MSAYSRTVSVSTDSCAMTVCARAERRLPRLAVRELAQRVGVQQVEHRGVAVDQRLRDRRRGVEPREARPRAARARWSTTGRSAARRPSRSASPSRETTLSSARAAPSVSVRSRGDDHDVVAAVAQQRGEVAHDGGAFVPAADAAPPRLPSSPVSARVERHQHGLERPRREAHDRRRVGVERGRPRRRDRELDLAPPDALADAQVPDRRLVDRVAVQQQDRVGELEVGDGRLQARATHSAAREVGPRGEQRRPELRRGTAAASRNASSLVVSPPAMAAAFGPAFLSAAAAALSGLLPGGRHAGSTPSRDHRRDDALVGVRVTGTRSGPCRTASRRRPPRGRAR